MTRLLALLLAIESSLLQIRVVEGGEGAVQPAGRRTPGLVLEISDELGKPVAGAVVSVRLPDDGPSGVFANGLASEIVTTGADGRAATSPIRWNRLAGPFQIRVTAMKDRLRAGTLVSQRLSDELSAVKRAPAPPSTPAVARARLRRKWLLWGLLAAGAGVGFATGWATRSGTPAAAAPLEIGAPTITIGAKP